jgi:DNA-binding NarL/FixJ family response regulator
MLKSCDGTEALQLCVIGHGSEMPETVWQWLKLGISGYCQFEQALSQFSPTLQAVRTGGCWLDPAAASVFRAYMTSGKDPLEETSEQATSFWAEAAQLTPRERAILKLLAKGHDDLSIAQGLMMSVDRIQSDIDAMMYKLNQSNRMVMVVKALKTGVIQFDEDPVSL